MNEYKLKIRSMGGLVSQPSHEKQSSVEKGLYNSQNLEASINFL